MRARKHWMAGWMNRQKNLRTVCRTTSPNRRTDVVDGAADDESADALSEQEESLIEEETTPDLPDFIPEEELPDFGGGTNHRMCRQGDFRSGHAEYARLSGDRRNGGRRR